MIYANKSKLKKSAKFKKDELMQFEAYLESARASLTNAIKKWDGVLSSLKEEYGDAALETPSRRYRKSKRRK